MICLHTKISIVIILVVFDKYVEKFRSFLSNYWNDMKFS